MAAAVGIVATAAAWLLLRAEKLSPSAAPAPSVDAIVVLPLEDQSPEKGAEYFAASMTEALTTDLARTGAFRVISRRSIGQYMQENGSTKGIASSLGADATVEGSIVRADGRVRISVQLTDAATESHLWADSYERDFVDVLALQGEVAHAIVSELAASATVGFERQPAVPRVDPVAHDLYLQGRHALTRCMVEGPNEAKELFERAIAANPSSAPAYAGLADYYAVLTLFDFLSPTEGFPKARAAALKALELDSELAEAHAALAHVEFMFDWDWQQAEIGFARALELNPSSAGVRQAYSFFLVCMGRFEEAVAHARAQIELDPLNNRRHLAWVLFNARRYEESLAELAAARPAEGDMGDPRWLMGWNYALLGRHEEAVEIFERLPLNAEDNPVKLGILGWTLASSGRTAKAMDVVQRLEELVAAPTGGDLYPQVIVQAGLGNIEQALDLLEKTVLQRSPNAIFLGVEPYLDPIRDDPRYRRLLAGMDLTDTEGGSSQGR